MGLSVFWVFVSLSVLGLLVLSGGGEGWSSEVNPRPPKTKTPLKMKRDFLQVLGLGVKGWVLDP